MRFGSVCSGIEAASCAWLPLGWECAFVSEIEAFPCAALNHHYPEVPNRGDMTKFKEWPDAAIDVLVGGTPCQSFSVAGLRKGLDDPRGNLMLTYLAIADRYRPTWLAWENVPGVLSVDGGRAFGAFLGGLAKLGYGFAYRILDAQFFGVPQRRRRVFVVGCFGDWRRAAAVLFERHSLSGNTAPRRQAGQRPAPTISARTKGGGGLGTDFDCDGGLLAFGGNNTSGPIDVATARSASASASASGRLDFESETFIAHSLRADGFDASEDGTGRGTPLVPIIAPCLTGNYGKQPDSSDTSAGPMLLPIAIQGAATRENPDSGPDGVGVRTDGMAYTLEARQEVQVVAFDTTQITSQTNRSNPQPGDPCHPIAAGAHPPAIAFDCKASGQNGFGIGDIASTLRSMGHTDSHQNGGGHQAVAFQSSQSGVREVEAHATLDSNNGARRHNGVIQGMQVRRLTPRECERLQGFEDDYTLIIMRGKPAADGPRYKALGNSMAVPVMAWIGRRIDAVTAIPPMCGFGG